MSNIMIIIYLTLVQKRFAESNGTQCKIYSSKQLIIQYKHSWTNINGMLHWQVLGILTLRRKQQRMRKIKLHKISVIFLRI